MLKRTILFLGAAAIVAAGAAAAAACGGSSSAKTSSSPDASGGSTAAASRAGSGTPGARGFGNRTPRPEVQTAIAEGTQPAGFGGQGGPGGLGGGGRRTVTDLAALLTIDATQLQTELQAPGATIAGVAAAHGMDRATLRQKLIDANRQRAADAVANGTLDQATADQNTSRFEASIDQLLDSNGARGPGPQTAPP